ncbi:MAG TPA: TonB family protein [Chryseolinea sp.]|nr:TonB family protein [Chryseolinea sp.]
MADLSDDIARYLSGQMSASEMHALEKKALDDPFLADALAGGESVPGDEFLADVTALNEQIAQRASKGATVAAPENAVKAEGRQVTLWSWPVRIAAGLLLLASASAIFYFLQDDLRQDSLALNDKRQESKQQEPKVDDLSPQISAETDSTGALAAEISGIQKTEHAYSETKPTADEQVPGTNADLSRQAISAPPAAAPQSQPAQPFTEETPEVISDAEAPPAERAERREFAFESEKDAVTSKNEDAKAAAGPTEGYIAKGAAAAKKSDKESKNIFTGKVIDADGAGIPGVNVIVKGSNTGTVTDINGTYQLALDEAKPTLVYTFIGYTNSEVVADVARPATVNLDEDVTQLSEVVVAGYGALRETDPLESTYEFAYPAGGKRQYKQYLEKSLQYPREALLNNVEGRVTVQFAIETTGSLVDFKVIKGIGSGCDEEVIRLIKSGPKWTPTKRDEVAEKSVIKVRMRFQLPKEKKKK